MAFSNTYDTTNPGSAVSNREDLTDVLSILAPEETPILSSLNKQKANATFVEWTVDSLADPETAGIREGADVTTFTDKFAGRARLGNYVQKFRRDFQVSDLQEAVDSVGPAKIAQAEAKSIRELKRDIEATLASANDRAVEDGAGTAYALRGLGDWLDSAGPSDVPAAFRIPSSSIVDSTLTESGFNDILGSIYGQTGELGNLTLVANIALRKVIANFMRNDSGASNENIYQVNQDATTKKITLSVSVFDSDFGLVRIVNGNPACMPTATTNVGYLLDPKYIGFSTLIPMGSTRLENQGGGERGYVDMAGTLVCRTPQAHGKIAY